MHNLQTRLARRRYAGLCQSTAAVIHARCERFRLLAVLALAVVNVGALSIVLHCHRGVRANKVAYTYTETSRSRCVVLMATAFPWITRKVLRVPAEEVEELHVKGSWTAREGGDFMDAYGVLFSQLDGANALHWARELVWSLAFVLILVFTPDSDGMTQFSLVVALKVAQAAILIWRRPFSGRKQNLDAIVAAISQAGASIILLMGAAGKDLSVSLEVVDAATRRRNALVARQAQYEASAEAMVTTGVDDSVEGLGLSGGLSLAMSAVALVWMLWSQVDERVPAWGATLYGCLKTCGLTDPPPTETDTEQEVEKTETELSDAKTLPEPQASRTQRLCDRLFGESAAFVEENLPWAHWLCCACIRKAKKSGSRTHARVTKAPQTGGEGERTHDAATFGSVKV